MFQLAQVNIARAAASMESDQMADFVARIEEINRLAESSPGYVWRYTGAADAETLAPLAHYLDSFEPDRLLFNLSVWTEPQRLRDYLYRTAHAELIAARKKWFLPLDANKAKPSVALWWIPTGTIPTVAEAAQRLTALQENGPTVFAFSLRQTFEAPRAQHGLTRGLTRS